MPHALTSRDSTMESKPIGSYPKSGIDVLIVGTGLAGLVAALECIRKGHNVKVLERNATINTAGTPLFPTSSYNASPGLPVNDGQATCTSWG